MSQVNLDNMKPSIECSISYKGPMHTYKVTRYLGVLYYRHNGDLCAPMPVHEAIVAKHKLNEEESNHG